MEQKGYKQPTLKQTWKSMGITRNAYEILIASGKV